jgi:hypothetical protein
MVYRVDEGIRMSTQSEIKEAFVAVAGVLRRGPGLAIGTGTSVTKVVDGLRREVSEGEWTMSVDMPEIVGGSGSAPTPGVYGRAALGSCLVLTYMMWASKEGSRSTPSRSRCRRTTTKV